ncbi:hypothetical protein PCANC_26925 [Puccinia coronata f. sp. avenae]|uniref:Uncharacterized protein n=1 Tax=Puccinia coronata f. sp. avenae TaxID=200324 RepID=A0A2N5TQM2_9BASI|nr:hypothetical protein PCANC_26925 [Puccinia coronata f. sp. avenae]PLW42275.1 hypothetical protein PCASD_07710 [Puccinia coronata f. sp. avenae]
MLPDILEMLLDILDRISGSCEAGRPWKAPLEVSHAVNVSNLANHQPRDANPKPVEN